MTYRTRPGRKSITADFMVVATSHRFMVHVPAATGALVVAEAFYKFGSFTLECLAFLGTWFVIQLPFNALYRRWRPEEPAV